MPLQKLVLIAKGHPFGKARITLRLNAIANGCQIEMSEKPVLAALAERRKPGEVHD